MSGSKTQPKPAIESNASKPSDPVTGTATCVVGCKLPNGIHIRLDVESTDPATGQKRFIPDGDRVTLAGANSSKVVGGYGLTTGVDEAFFDRWLANNKNFPPVKNGLIFKQSSEDKASDEALERSGEKTGMEGLDPTKPGPNIAPADTTQS